MRLEPSLIWATNQNCPREMVHVIQTFTMQYSETCVYLWSSYISRPEVSIARVWTCVSSWRRCRSAQGVTTIIIETPRVYAVHVGIIIPLRYTTYMLFDSKLNITIHTHNTCTFTALLWCSPCTVSCGFRNSCMSTCMLSLQVRNRDTHKPLLN